MKNILTERQSADSLERQGEITKVRSNFQWLIIANNLKSSTHFKIKVKTMP